MFTDRTVVHFFLHHSVLLGKKLSCQREAARCFMLSQSRSLKVIQNIILEYSVC